MPETHADAWKYWVRTSGQLYCFIVTIGDPELAEQKLRSREPVGQMLDRERLPQRVFDALDLRPNEVIGFKSLRL